MSKEVPTNKIFGNKVEQKAGSLKQEFDVE